MTKRIIRLTAATMAALAAAGAAAQATAPRKLAHDPFDRAVVQQLLRQAESKSAAAASAADASGATAPAAAQTPVLAAELRAVMAGGARPLVNLGGSILGIGDSIGGYRLVEVRENSAIFARDGKRVELALGSKRQP